MKRLTRILRKIFVLPPLPTVLAAVFGYGFVLAVAIFRIEIPAIQYISYIASAYALTVTVTVFPRLIPFVKRAKRRVGESAAVKKFRATALGERFFGDVRFRTELSLYGGLLINFLYVGMKLYSGIYYRSVWFIALAAYYALLAAMRFILLHKGKRGGAMTMEDELKRYRLCGAMLLIMNQALAGIVVFMVRQNKGFDYPGILIYAMAAYSFYSVIIAAVNLVKSGKYGSPVLSAAKAVSLVAATVSILSLETAMLAQFGGNDGPGFRRLMTGLTGGGVCVIVIGMAGFMLWKSTRRLKELRLMSVKGEIEHE